MPKPVNGNGRYMVGLDGLRALAVLAVIAYHLNLKWIPGGLLGVGVFFVLSGYLITDLLIAEWKRHKGIDLKQFWLRRAKRLLPAMLVMLFLITAWIVFFDSEQRPALGGDVLSALLYVNNWWYIYHEVSYFEKFGPASPFGHLWSLAVEEQFYLLWPLVLALGLRFSPRRGRLAVLTLALAAVSAVAMALIFQPGTDPSRVYYGTDTRAFAMLIGAAFALLFPSAKLAGMASQAVRRSLDLVGGFGMLAIVYMIVQTNEYDTFLYRGGFVLLSLATALVVVALAHPDSLLGKWLGWKPLRWIGVRSYGIYLWHYPVIVMTSPAVDTVGGDVPRAIVQLAATIGLAALSWRYIENPIRHGAIGRLWLRLRTRDGLEGRMPRKLWVASACTILAIVIFSAGVAKMSLAASGGTDNSNGGNGDSVPAWMAETDPEKNATNKGTGQPNDGLINSKLNDNNGGVGTAAGNKPQSNAGDSPNDGMKNETGPANDGISGNNPKQPAKDKSGDPIPNETQGSSDKPAKDTTAKPPKDTNKGGSDADKNHQPSQTGSDVAGEDGAAGAGKGVTVIGDSVMIGAKEYLEKLLPGIIVDGKVGRQMKEAQQIVEELKSRNALGSRVVIELGTNGSFTKKQLETLLQSMSDVQQVMLVNIRVPRKWEETVNSTLADTAGSFPNVTLLDWYEASKGNDSFFYNDGVHLKPQGAQFYASFIAKAVQPAMTEKAYADNKQTDEASM